MVSRLPVFSGKRVGKRVPPEGVLPVFVAAVLFVALLISYPWIVLSIGTIGYLALLPFGWRAHQNNLRRDIASAHAARAAAAASGNDGLTAATGSLVEDEDRPARLN
jgi:CDP-diacylglycerol--serine O-phosphatidyltransferase